MDAPLDTFRPSTSGWLLGTLAGWGTILLGIAGIVLAIIGWKWFQNISAKYEVTEERLIVRRGIFVKSIDEVELYRVKDVRINFTIINQVSDIGTISMSSSDETTRGGDLVLRDIKRARERRETLRRLVDTARQKRRVREVDMVHEDI